jgi:hypothetical protein
MMLNFAAAVVAGFVALAATTAAQAQCTPQDQLVINDIQSATAAMLQGQSVDLNWLRSRSQSLSASCAAFLNSNPGPTPTPDGECTPRQQQAAISCNGLRDYRGRLCDCHQFSR